VYRVRPDFWTVNNCDIRSCSLFSPSRHVTVLTSWSVYPRGVVLKKKWGTPETRLKQRFLNSLGLHTRQINCYSGSLVLSCDTATRVWVSVRSVVGLYFLWQLLTRSLAVVDMTPERLCVHIVFPTLRAASRDYWPDFPIRSHSPDGGSGKHMDRICQLVSWVCLPESEADSCGRWTTSLSPSSGRRRRIRHPLDRSSPSPWKKTQTGSLSRFQNCPGVRYLTFICVDCVCSPVNGSRLVCWITDD